MRTAQKKVLKKLARRPHRRGLLRELRSVFHSAMEMAGAVHPDEIADERERIKKLLLEVLRELRCT